MIYLFFGLLVTIAEIIAHVSMLGVFAESKQWYKKYKYIYIPLTSIGCYLITVWLDEYMYIKFAVMFLIFVLISNAAVNIRVYVLAALSIMFFNFTTLLEFLIGMIVIKIGLFNNVSENWAYFILPVQVILAEVIILSVFTIVCKKNQVKLVDTQTLLAKKDWTGIFLISLVSWITISIAIQESGLQDANPVNIFIVLIGVVVAFLDVAIIHLFVQSTKRQKHILENEAVLNRVKNETMLYHAITENMEKQSRRIHEFNNRMTAIKSMLDQGKIEELQKYVDSIEAKIKEYPQIFNTKNAIVDAIMTAKYEEMVNNNILFVHKFSELAEVKIADDDLVILLSNLLNNAIEACMKAEKRIIKMKFVVDEKHIVLSVTNTFADKPSEMNGELVTSKNDELGNHGIGIKNVKEIVEKYDGGCTVNYDDEWFFVAILIHR